jgi:hypothetical protein
MRTTLDIDDALLESARARFPAGTPKTVIFEEALRRLLAGVSGSESAETHEDPRLVRLAAEGRLRLATRRDLPPSVGGGVPLDTLLSDLTSDRGDREWGV